MAYKGILQRDWHSEETDRRVRALFGVKHRSEIRFALEQAEPSGLQFLNERPVAIGNGRVIRQQIHAFANVPWLHGRCRRFIDLP